MRLFDALWHGNYTAARTIDADLVAFHCRQCSQVYCDQCWRIDAPVFDEGFYDYTMGRCPQGHEQIVDD